MLKNRTAVVTGSTSGIGLGIARELAKAGANIMLNGFGNSSEVERLVLDMKAECGVKVGYSPADVGKPKDIIDLIEQTNAELGSVDIVVNNAGIQHTAPTSEFPVDRWDAIIAINLSAAFHATKAALQIVRVSCRERV